MHNRPQPSLITLNLFAAFALLREARMGGASAPLIDVATDETQTARLFGADDKGTFLDGIARPVFKL